MHSRGGSSLLSPFPAKSIQTKTHVKPPPVSQVSTVRFPVGQDCKQHLSILAATPIVFCLQHFICLCWCLVMLGARKPPGNPLGFHPNKVRITGGRKKITRKQKPTHGKFSEYCILKTWVNCSLLFRIPVNSSLSVHLAHHSLVSILLCV